MIDNNTINDTTVGIEFSAATAYQDAVNTRIFSDPNTMSFVDLVDNTINVPASGYLHPDGIYFNTGYAVRSDSSFLGFNIADNTINQTTVSNGSNDGAVGIGLPGMGLSGTTLGNSWDGPAGPGTFIVLQGNVIDGFSIDLLAWNDPDCFVYKNTFTAGTDSRSPIVYTATTVPYFSTNQQYASSLLVQDNNAIGFAGNMLYGPIPPPTLILPQDTIYLTSDGNTDVVQTFSLQNSGADDLSWTASIISHVGSYWLSLQNYGGTIPGQSSQPSSVLVANPVGLLPGSYWQIITIIYDDGLTSIINVNLIVS